MRWFTLVSMLLLAADLLSAAQGPDKAVQEDLKKLEGTWTYLSVDLAGKKLPDDIISTGSLTIKGNTYKTELFGQVTDEGTFTIDPSKKPKTMDYMVTDGPNKGKTQLGIYELDGDTAKFCFAVPGAERPTDFTSKEGSGRTLSVWKKEKK